MPIGTKRRLNTYSLPDTIDAENYMLKIQKQAGISDVPVAVHIIGKNGIRRDFSYTMNEDIVVE